MHDVHQREKHVKAKKQYVRSVRMTLFLLGASILTRESVAKAWAETAGGEQPQKKSNWDVGPKEAAAWALVSGSVVGLARMLVRRTKGYKGTQAQQLTIQ